MRLEEVQEVALVLLAEAFEVEDFAEVGVGFVADVDEVGLHQSFRRGRPHLERFENGVDARHGLRHALEIARRWRRGRGGIEGEEFRKALLEAVRIQKHLWWVSVVSALSSTQRQELI